MKHIMTFTALMVFCLIGTAAVASSTLNTEDSAPGIVEMNSAYSAKALTKAELRTQKRANKAALRAEKHQIRKEKRAAKFNAMLQKVMNKKKIGGLDDPIDKWMWFGIAALVVGTVLWIVISWPAAVIGLLIWLGGLGLMGLWAWKKWGDG